MLRKMCCVCVCARACVRACVRVRARARARACVRACVRALSRARARVCVCVRAADMLFEGEWGARRACPSVFKIRDDVGVQGQSVREIQSQGPRFTCGVVASLTWAFCVRLPENPSRTKRWLRGEILLSRTPVSGAGRCVCVCVCVCVGGRGVGPGRAGCVGYARVSDAAIRAVLPLSDRDVSKLKQVVPVITGQQQSVDAVVL